MVAVKGHAKQSLAVATAPVSRYRGGRPMQGDGRPATGRWLQGRLVIRAGCLGPVRKLHKVSQNIKRLVALGIDRRILAVAVSSGTVN